MKNYKQTASDVLRLVGGEKNVVQVEHCSTRLRFTLADTSKADVAALKKTAGVMGVISSGPQCQVVIGNDVIEVYDELLKLGTFNAGQAAAPAAPKGKKEIGGIILDYMVGIFQPLVPAIAGAGVLKALMVLLSTLGVMSSGDIAYKVFVGVADAALYYLPVMVAFTTATKFNCNKLVAVALAAAMIHPSVSALLATEGGAYFLGIKLQNIAYGGQVFPAILTVIFMSFIEKWANKWCPKAIRVFFVPMLCFGIGFPVALVVLGPLGYNIGALLTTVILALYNTLGWLAVALLAAVLPFMISMGMHKALVPYAVASISDPGFEMLYMPASLAHNISEGGACLGVALKTKDENLRATAISAGISGLFGITEPALYGVTLQHKKVMMSVVISSFIGGLFVGLMKVKAFVAMGPGLAGMAMFVDPDNSKNILWAAIGLVISVVASFALSFFLYKDETPAEGETAETAPEAAADAAAVDSTISSPLQGKAIALDQVKDEVFSQKILGDGIAVVPEKGELYAPADGVIESVFGTKHAVSMKTAAGAELLMHIGMDTVKRDGKGFDPQVKDGETVKKGQLLMKFDLDGIKADGYDVTTPIVVTNADEFTIKTVAEGTVVPGAALLKLEAVK